MKQWVAEHDPGIKISLSEYNMDLGGSDNSADTLLEADALGIFAREGLDMATEWDAPQAGDPEANAFRLYRDYDGQGAKFGDQYLTSTSSDQGQLAIYGAQNAATVGDDDCGDQQDGGRADRADHSRRTVMWTAPQPSGRRPAPLRVHTRARRRDGRPARRRRSRSRRSR